MLPRLTTVTSGGNTGGPQPTNDEPGTAAWVWRPAAVGTLTWRTPSPSLSTCGLRMSSCEREGRGQRKDTPPKALPVPSVPLPLTFQSLLRSSPSKFQLHHPMHWSPHERSAPGDCVLVSAFSKVDLGSV